MGQPLMWVSIHCIGIRCYPHVSIITRGETNQSPVLRVTSHISANQRPVLGTCPSLPRGETRAMPRYWTTTPGWCEVWRGLTSIRINKYQANTETQPDNFYFPWCLPLGFSFNFPELYLRQKDQKYCIMMINYVWGRAGCLACSPVK